MIDHRISERIRNRIQEILVADGVPGARALDEANSLSDGLGYYERVKASTGLGFHRGYDGIEVRGLKGDTIDTIPFDRLEEFY